MKKIVVPGELLTEKPSSLLENAYVRDGKAYAQVFGVYQDGQDAVRVTPLSTKYAPKEGDLVLGIVENVKFAGVDVDIRASNSAFLRTTEAPRGMTFQIGDLLLVRILDVDEVRSANLSSATKIEGGELMEVNPAKVPRVIGSKQSMINLLKEKTGCKIVAGLNGRVWVDGKNSGIVSLALRKISEESHKSGLTEKVTAFVDLELKK